MTGVLPKLRVTEAERNPQWYKDHADYRIDQTNYWSGDRWELIRLYKAAAGQLDKTEYKYVLNPYNSTDENVLNWPAMLRNVDIISPIISALMGEKANRPFNHRCVVANPDSPSKGREELDKAFVGVLAQSFVNNLNESGYPTGVPSKKVPPYEKILEKYQVDAADKRAIFGQEALDYIKYDLDLKDKFQEALYDWIVTGRTFSFKDVYSNDLIYEIVPPLEMWHGTTRTGFIEDADWVVRKTRFNFNQVIDRFHKVLSPDEIKNLEAKFKEGNQATTNIQFGGGTPNIDKAANVKSDTGYVANSDLIDVWHIQWLGLKRIGILSYVDRVTGATMEAEVSDGYKLSEENGDISIEWIWNSCAYEVYKIGDGEDALYKDARPIQVPREELSNPSKVKLSYNGRVGYNERTTVSSIVKQLLEFQALYNTFHFRRELTLARNKDKLAVFPIGLVPEEFGTGVDGLVKFLHFVETTSFMFFDEQKEGALQVLNAIKNVDISLGQYVASMTDLLRSIKEEAWDSVGMNRQRYGDINTADGKGVTDQAIVRSATITRELNRRFEKFEESDLQGLIDYSKLAWIDGKKGMYITSDGRRAFLEVDPDIHSDTDYGVFAVDSMEEEANLKQGKQFAFGWAQKSTAPASIVLNVLDSNNMSSLKAKVAQMEQIEKEYQDSVKQQEYENQQAIQDKKDLDSEKDRQKDITVAEIQAGATTDAATIRAAATPSKPQEEVWKDDDYNSIIERIRKQDASNFAAGKEAYDKISDRRYKEADLSLKEKQIDNQLKIAKANKNRYDK